MTKTINQRNNVLTTKEHKIWNRRILSKLLLSFSSLVVGTGLGVIIAYYSKPSSNTPTPSGDIEHEVFTTATQIDNYWKNHKVDTVSHTLTSGISSPTEEDYNFFHDFLFSNNQFLLNSALYIPYIVITQASPDSFRVEFEGNNETGFLLNITYTLSDTTTNGSIFCGISHDDTLGDYIQNNALYYMPPDTLSPAYYKSSKYDLEKYGFICGQYQSSANMHTIQAFNSDSANKPLVFYMSPYDLSSVSGWATI